MRIRIISKGLGRTTHVEDAETGEMLEGVVAVSWECKVDGLATAKLTIKNFELDAIGETEENDG